LGTAIKPIGDDHYDLDLACNLQQGISKRSHSQSELKKMVGRDLEAYRCERGIKDELDEKHRCWRLNYQDKLSFHMDTVPCIPQEVDVLNQIETRMLATGLDNSIAREIASLAVSITDDRLTDYNSQSDNWPISNPEGYARWFEERMKLASRLLNQHAKDRFSASITEVPTFQWKSPLQRCVKILKRHRDKMFQHHPEVKPISIIITTLSANAYTGESNEVEALQNILDQMHLLVNTSHPRVPNPVNPVEDFADRWDTPEGKKLRLKENFWTWLEQARADFCNITAATERGKVAALASQKFNIHLRNDELEQIPGLSSSVAIGHTYSIQESRSAKPWMR
jgi:hypothetical protein